MLSRDLNLLRNAPNLEYVLLYNPTMGRMVNIQAGYLWI